ncbi:uncharacterized protein LOC144476978 isoform X2 [Augochlora pura]
MMEETFEIVDKLSDVIRNMQKCLRCSICLHPISNPMRTRCGHRFCRECIQKVLQSKNSTCPLCNSVIKRRDTREDGHIEIYIDRLEKLMEAVQKDTGIDVTSYRARRPSTVESCSSGSRESAKQNSEEYIQPSCSYAQPKPLKKSASSRAKRAALKSKRSSGSKSKKDDAPESSVITKYFPKYSISGVEPLLPDQTNYDDESSAELKVHSWLENLPANIEARSPRRSNTPDTNLNDTLLCSVSEAGEKKVDGDGLEAKSAEPFEEIGSKRNVTVGRSSKDQKDKDNRETMIKAVETRRASSASAPRANDAAGGMQTSRVDRRQSASSYDKSDNERDGVQEQDDSRRSDVQKTSPCDLLPSTKKNWTSVVQFGKEMRSKRPKKIRSLNVSIENRSKKLANESAKERAPRQKKLSGGSVRRSAERPSVADNDANEKLPVHKNAKKQQFRNKNNGSMARATRAAGRSSFIAFEEGEQVHRRNLNNPGTNEIVEAADQQQNLVIENLTFDEDSENKFLRELGLQRTPPRRRIVTSSTGVTPVRNPVEDSPNLLEGYVSPSVDVEMAPIVQQSPASFQSSTPLLSRLSLKRPEADPKFDDPAATDSNSRLHAVKRDLNHEICRAENIVAAPTKSANTLGEREGNNMTGNRHVEDAKACKCNVQRKSMTMFKKLGKLVKCNMKVVRFLYLGSTRRRLPTPHERNRRRQTLDDPMKHESIVNLSSKNNFGSNARFTVNNAEPSQNSTGVGSSASREKVAAVDPKGKGTSQSDSESTKSSVIPVAPRIVIDSLDPISKDIISATAASEPRDSNDILMVSIYENEGNVVRPVRQNTPSKATTAFNSTVNILSSKDDSQLKFLDLYSPTRNTQRAVKFAQQDDEDIGAKRSNLSDTRGVHSRALVRTSMQGSGGPETDDAPRKTREKSTSRNNLVQKTSRTTEVNDHQAGATYSKGPVAHGKNDAMDCRPSSHSGQIVETITLSSDLEAGNGTYTRKQQKKVYKRIKSPSTDSSLSSKRSNFPGLNQQPGTSTATKRKRSATPDSDSYKDVDMIVDSWSRDLQPSNKFSKIDISTNIGEHWANAKSSFLNSPRISRRTGPVQRIRLSSSDSDPNSSKVNAKMGQGPSGKGSFDNDSPDFGATIDSVRNIQRAATTSGDKEPTRQRREEVACLMQDNFDEIIANVDTEQLISDYCRPRKRKCHAGVDSARNVREDGRFKDASVSRLCKGSDKENECDESGRLYDSETDGDKTLTPEHVNAADKSSKIGDDRSREQTKPVKSTSQQPATRNNVANRLSTINPALPGSDRILENTVNDVTLKETCFEQDSLMDITQHQMIIKQFEDDLFGRAANAQTPVKQERPSQTENWNGNASTPLNLKEEDAEHSTEEDDIVENTPHAKTRNMQPTASSAKEFSTKIAAAQTSKASRRCLSSEFARSTTPVREGGLQPVCQSTPKVHGQAKDDCAGAAIPFAGQMKLENANEPKNRTANEVAGFNGQREKLCFLCSGLLPTQIQEVTKLASLTNANYLKSFDLRVTHVIVKADEKNNSASKTLKYLQGIANRKWVVGYQWVVDSLREKKLVNEERYEVVDGSTFETGARNSRLRQKELFKGFTFLCIGPYVDISVEQYEELLRATGGTVVRSLGALAARTNHMAFIVVQEQAHEDKIIEWHKKTRAVPIVHDWILECISQYKLIPFYPYLQELLPQDVLDLGYPRHFLEDELDEEDYDSADDTVS